MDGSCEVDEDRVRAQGALVWVDARDASAPVSPAFRTDSTQTSVQTVAMANPPAWMPNRRV